MAKRCGRPGCGHDEADHLETKHGGCFGRQAITGHRCVCSEFVDAEAAPRETAKAPSVPPPMRRSSTPPPLRVVTELEPVKDRAEALERAAACKRTAELTPPRALHLDSFREAIEEPEVLRTMRIHVGGKMRELTEINAAANGIIAETNAADLATGVFTMRQTIRTQANELVTLRAELEALRKPRAPVTNVNVKIDVQGEVHPAALAVAMHNAAEDLLKTLQPKA